MLLPLHQLLIDRSGISPEVAQARGYRSVDHPAALGELGFAGSQCLVPALVMPIRNLGGDVIYYQIRPDRPRSVEGKAAKYEVPANSELPLDFPPAGREKVKDSAAPLHLVEGVRQADAGASHGLACVNLLGRETHLAASKSGKSGKVGEMLEAAKVPLEGRTVYLAFSTEVTKDRRRVKKLDRLKRELESRGAKVGVVHFPVADGGQQVGLDDYLAAGGSIDQIAALASFEELSPPSISSETAEFGGITARRKVSRKFNWRTSLPELCHS